MMRCSPSLVGDIDSVVNGVDFLDQVLIDFVIEDVDELVVIFELIRVSRVLFDELFEHLFPVVHVDQARG